MSSNFSDPLTFEKRLVIDDFIHDAKNELRFQGSIIPLRKLKIYQIYKEIRDYEKISFLDRETVNYFINKISETPLLKEEFAEVFEEIEKDIKIVKEKLISNLETCHKKEYSIKTEKNNSLKIELPPTIDEWKYNPCVKNANISNSIKELLDKLIEEIGSNCKIVVFGLDELNSGVESE